MLTNEIFNASALLKGMDDDSIMELTGLTHEQLHQLKS